jgi:hypothetical protein
MLQQGDERHDRQVDNLTLRKLVGKTPGFPHGVQAPEVAKPLGGLTHDGESPVVSKHSKDKAMEFESLGYVCEMKLGGQASGEQVQGAHPQGARMLGKGHICKVARVSTLAWSKTGRNPWHFPYGVQTPEVA